MKALKMFLASLALLFAIGVPGAKAQQPIVNASATLAITNSNQCTPVTPGYGIQFVSYFGSCGAPIRILSGNTGYTSFSITVSGIPSGATLQVVLVGVPPSGPTYAPATCFLTSSSPSCTATFSSSTISSGDWLELTFNLPMPQNASGATMTAALAVWAIQ